jgi:hypothetical protein
MAYQLHGIRSRGRPPKEIGKIKFEEPQQAFGPNDSCRKCWSQRKNNLFLLSASLLKAVRPEEPIGASPFLLFFPRTLISMSMSISSCGSCSLITVTAPSLCALVPSGTLISFQSVRLSKSSKMTKQRPENKQPYNSRCQVNAPYTTVAKEWPQHTHATMTKLLSWCSLCGPYRGYITRVSCH